MEQKFQLAKNYNYLADLQVTHYVDCKDTVNHWCVGEIVDVDDDKNQVKVHFEGWTSRYDEWTKKTSQRLAPFRKHTEGYTGQKKNAYRDFKINYTQHNFNMNKVKQIRESDFKCFDSPFELTKFVRGELYFYIDSLISLYSSTNSDDLPAIRDFMQEVFLLIIKWMEIFPQYLKTFNECLQQPQLYLVDYDAAISQCGNELFGILEKCFGLCPRCMRFFQKFSNDLLYEGTFGSKDKQKSHAFMLTLINVFGEMGGFEKVLEFILFEVKDSKGKLFKGCPFILTMKALRPFTLINEYADKQFSQSFAENVRSSLAYRLDNLSENEIKEIDKEILRETIDVLKKYIKMFDPQSSDQIAELYELNLAAKYLRCPFFEKRVRGINDLKEIYYKVMNSIKPNKQTMDNQGIEYTKWLNPEKYAAWIIKEKITDIIFKENPHVELIKRSIEILRLLAQDEQLFTPELVDLMWSCCREKHEDIVRATYDLIQDLALSLPLERLAHMFSKIQLIKEQEFDEKTVIFLKNYTVNSIKNINKAKKGDAKQGSSITNLLRTKKEIQIDPKSFYDLNKFWLIFQDSNKVLPKIKDLALNCLIEILLDANDKELKDYFTQTALENIKKGDTFLNSLIFLRKILNTYPVDSQQQFRMKSSTTSITVSQILQQDVFKKVDLFEFIFINTQSYLHQAQKACQSKLVQVSQGEKLQSLVLNGNVTHEEFIKVVMSFIEFVLVNSQISLQFDHVEKMFYMFVQNAVTEFEINCLFAFLTKENELAKSKVRKFLLDDKVRNEVFLKIFCNNQSLNYEKLNYQGFLCFKKLFMIVNEEEKSLEVFREDRIAVNNLNNLQGIESLWIIAIQCNNKLVQDICKDFLVDLYLKAKTKSNAQRKFITEQFTGKCLQYFKNSHDRNDHQLNCLRLIKAFIRRFDGEHILEEDMAIYDPKEIRPVQVTLNPDKIVQSVKIHPNQKLWQLKRKMADLFKLKLSEFYIKTKGGPLEDNIYDDQIKEYSIQQVHIQRVTKEEMEKEFPSYLIGYNLEYTNILIELLQIGNEICKREVLSLLETLPINIEIKLVIVDQLKKLVQDAPSSDWEKMFRWNGSDLSPTVYYLMGLEDLMIPKKEIATPEMIMQDQQSKADFCSRFIQKGGFSFIYNLLCSLSKNGLEKDTLKTKILTSISRIIQHLLSNKQFIQFKGVITVPQVETLISQALTIIDSFIFIVKTQQSNTIGDQEEKETRMLANDINLLQYAFSFLNKAICSYQQCIQTLYQYQGIEEIVRSGLIEIENEAIQKVTMDGIGFICMQLEMSQTLQVKPSFFFMKVLIKTCLEYALQKRGPSTKNFFELLNKLQCNTDVYQQLSQITPIEQLTQQITNMIMDREILEISAKDEDVPLSGLFIFLKNIFDKFPTLREDYKDKNKLLKYLMHDCLFHKETKGHLISKDKAMPPKCKNISTRENCLRLLNSLCNSNQEGIHLLTRYLKKYIGETFWRTPRKTDWAISVHQQERSLTGFVGMKNMGCICYMNSIMQQLFMIPTFRKCILEVEDNLYGQQSNEENLIYQLKMIFGGLMEVEKQYYNPKRFLQTFKDFDGSSIDPMVQRDVDEFFNMMMDRIENLISGKKEEKVIKNLFQGVFANELICKGCPHNSEREEPFLAVSLQVKNKHSIKESLDSFVEGEMLEGDNAYYCEKCEKKVNTLKRCCIKRMPNVLFIVLKRFEYNFDTMTKFKINDYCEFPTAMNMVKYSQEDLSKQALLKQMEEKNLTMEDLTEDQKAILQKQIPSKYYEYNLKGTVIHLGTAEQGHYYSFIQDRENTLGKWYEFNDTIVRDFDSKDIPHEAFGGEDESVVYNIQNMQGNNSERNDPAMLQAMKQFKTKIRNAYILIYEREDVLDMEKFNELMDNPAISTNKQEMLHRYEQCKLTKTISSQIQMPPYIHDTILEKNKKFWLSKFIFNKTYIDSVLNIFKDVKVTEDQDYQKAREMELQQVENGQFELFKFLTTFFLTTVIRAKERKAVPHFMKIIREALQKNISLSVWFVETFCSQDIIKEFLIDCPIHDMKRFVTGLLDTAIKAVFQFEEKQLYDYAMMSDLEQLEYVRKTQKEFIIEDKVIDIKVASQQLNAQNTKALNQDYQSGCQELSVIVIKHHTPQLPLLIVLMNAFIHQSVSLHNIRNQVLCGQFYMVFSKIVELGEATRLYLLKNKSIGRFLDLFFNYENQKQILAVSHRYRSETLVNLPLIHIQKQLYIENNLEKDVFITAAERKVVFHSATNHNTFLLYTVSVLARSCMFVKIQTKNPYSNDDINYVLDNEEMKMLINHSSEKLWDNCENKLARNAIADMYAHVSYENREFSLQYLTTLLQCIQRATFDKLRTFERPMLKMLQIQDNYQVDRVKKALNNLLELMKTMTTYYKELDSMIEFIYKLASRCPMVVDVLNKSQPFFRFIDQWQKDNYHFPLNQSKVKIFKQGIIQWNNLKPNFINETTINKVSQYSKDRLMKLNKLIQKELPTVENTYDSDDDMYHHKFQEKERIDFADSSENQWHTGYIEIALDEMVKCVSESSTTPSGNPMTIWIETESDKLAPPNTYTMSEKRRMYSFYMSLLRSANIQGGTQQ